MNMKVALVFTLVPFVSLTTQSNAESDLAVGLAAHYRFDGNSTDATAKQTMERTVAELYMVLIDFQGQGAVSNSTAPAK